MIVIPLSPDPSRKSPGTHCVAHGMLLELVWTFQGKYRSLEPPISSPFSHILTELAQLSLLEYLLKYVCHKL
jgi:hypothetical protein